MPTAHEHLEASKALKDHIDAADALANKLAQIIRNARSTLIALQVFAPDDRLKIDAPYHLRAGQDNAASMRSLIERQVKVIDEALGVGLK